MRWMCLITLLFSTALYARPVTASSSADELLDALDARGKDLKTLSADVKTTTLDDLGEAARSNIGHLWYEKLADQNARFRASFDKVIVGKMAVADKHDWLFTDGRLVDRDYHSKKQSTRQVLRPGEKMELFKLEGPFPLPLGQDKSDVHKAFDVTKAAAAKDDPAGTAHLTLVPVKGTDLAKKFSKIDLWVDPASSLPVRIDAVDADGATTKQTYLTNVKVNDPLKDADFELEKIDLKGGGWNETDDRFR